MKHPFSRAALAIVVTIAAACADTSNAPTNPAASPSLAQSAALASRSTNQGFAFHGEAAGFPTGAVRLSGGGSFDATTASNTVPTETRVHAAGEFRCTRAVAQGPLSGCGAGEGVRWDTAQLLASTNFKCSPADVAKPAVTGPGRVVLLADFYRAGDGDHESFTAQMIVSETDLAPNIPGVQTFWIQGVGCGNAHANFSH
jgi:hypothetical protein